MIPPQLAAIHHSHQLTQQHVKICLEALTADQLVELRIALGLAPTADLAEICLAIDALATVEALILVLDEAGLSVTAIVDLLACLGIDVDLLGIDVGAIVL